MTVEEIFSKLIAHMREGVMFHRDMADAYDFLGLKKLRKCHNYHMEEEMRGCRRLMHYYVKHYRKLIVAESLTIKSVIPNNWYKYTSKDVDNATRKSALRELMEKWIDWEQETKALYQNMWRELTSIGEIAAANELSKYINNVSEELNAAQQELLEIEITNYDMVFVIDKQVSRND